MSSSRSSLGREPWPKWMDGSSYHGWTDDGADGPDCGIGQLRAAHSPATPVDFPLHSIYPIALTPAFVVPFDDCLLGLSSPGRDAAISFWLPPFLVLFGIFASEDRFLSSFAPPFACVYYADSPLLAIEERTGEGGRY
ncbi:hypothetical protein G7046_g6433 [Stylonectria norvegica]|nr:hypothetical protein G7046_g6433 [Stylonectria norvegica]